MLGAPVAAWAPAPRTPPYSRIDMWSSENAGHLDFNAEMELWTRAGHIKIKLGRGVDVRRLDNLISQMVLSAR